jgi:predicted NAD-dependent protein-ADP-ribosyltransferase YbiA (DUF1768 family)
MEKLLYTEIGPTGSEYKKGDWKDFVVHNEHEIKGFFGEFAFLSNFWPAKVFLDDVEYTSVELAYQAAKWKPENRGYFQTCTESRSIKYNRKNKPDGYTDEDWNIKKNEVMFSLLKQKFDSVLNPENYKKLQDTGDKYLEELNWWKDIYWGKNKAGVGQNILGVMLMKVRQNDVI